MKQQIQKHRLKTHLRADTWSNTTGFTCARLKQEVGAVRRMSLVQCSVPFDSSLRKTLGSVEHFEEEKVLWWWGGGWGVGGVRQLGLKEGADGADEI